jgi:hypothetical protein
LPKLHDKFVFPVLAFAAFWILVALPVIYLPSDRIAELHDKAPIFTPFVAILAVAVAWTQLSINRDNQRETTANTNFREFLKLCVQYPDLASGQPHQCNQERYEWFIAHFLWAAEEVLEFAPNDWKENLRLYVEYHRDYLKNDDEFRRKDFRTYTRKLQIFVDETIAALPMNDSVAAS